MKRPLEIIAAASFSLVALLPGDANPKNALDTNVSRITYNVSSSRLNNEFYRNNRVGLGRYFHSEGGNRGKIVCLVTQSDLEKSKGPLDVTVHSPYTLKDCQERIAAGYSTVFWGEVVAYTATNERFDPAWDSKTTGVHI